ncbi:MAG TPA: DegT/DnrJ/EryC1/StrS aminotransferase family protein [Acidobacteriota bacterium]|nr:DegT/DnrJ/EryC1/StrS aminotransferase family protein [Acidobacteriota bacterium]
MQVRLFKPRVTEEAITAAANVMRSGWLGMGPVTSQFEKAFAQYIGVSRALAVNTCTSALHLAVKLLRLAPGTEVITSPLTFVAANEVLLYEGLTPVFADIDSKTGNLTPQSVAAKLSDRTGAVMLTHYGGYACDLDGFRQSTALPIVEDCAHACGAWYRDARVGASGNLCAFSFDPIKNLTTGDGGMLICPDESQDKRARTLRYMGLSKDAFTRLKGSSRSWEYEVPEIGYRYHMNDVAAALGLAHLKLVDEDNTRREAIAARYRRLLAAVPGVGLLEYAPDRRSSYHLFTILAEHRGALSDKLGKAGVIVGGHYARNDVYRIFHRAELPDAECFCSRLLTLPMHAELTDEEIDYVCGVIREGW